MQGVFYWGMKISRKEVDLLWNELSLNDYSYLREHYMFDDGYIFGEIIESIYPVEGPLDIFKADRAEAIFFNISSSYGRRDEYDETKDNILKALNREE